MKINDVDYERITANSLMFSDYSSGIWHVWSFTKRDKEKSKRHMVCGVYFLGNGEQGARFYKNLNQNSSICPKCLEGSKY